MATSLHLAMLLIHDDGDYSVPDDVKKCARPLTDDTGKPIFGSITLHQLMILISAPCLALTIISTIFLSWRHLHRYTAPQEQRQILRIINLPAAYSIFNFLALCFYQDYFYIEPIAGIYEAFTVAALFLLTLEYVCPDGTDREKYFSNLPEQDRKGVPTGNGSLVWFQRTWASVLQYPLTKLIFSVIQIITQYYGVFCENSFSPKYAHIWLTLADILFIGGALGATIRFFRRLVKEIDPIHRGRPKVWSFIGILIFQILQMLIFHLMNGKLFNPSATATYNDINFGIPAFLTCIEAVIFSLIFQWSFSSKEYATRQDRYGSGPAQRTRTFRAILDALNLADIVAGTWIAIQMLFKRVQSRYGARSNPQRENNTVGLEPLADRRRMRGYSGGSESDGQYSPPLDTEYEGGMGPSLPKTARDPSPLGRARTYRADELRPSYGGQEYQPLTRSREPSPSGVAAQYPRQMV